MTDSDLDLRLISVALSHDFTMSALLALSASHLAWQTKNSDTDNLAYHHRGVALKGLHEAIGAFSRDNSEAILAASIMLSWQSADWYDPSLCIMTVPFADDKQAWLGFIAARCLDGMFDQLRKLTVFAYQLQVLSAMRQWLHESELARYLETQRTIAKERTPATPTLPQSQLAIPHEDLRRLEQMTTAVHNLRLRLPTSGELVEHAGQLFDYLQDVQRDLHLQAPDKAFARLQPLRDLIFWLPTHILRSAESDLAPLALLSHLYASALATEPLSPKIGGAYLGSMSVSPLENVHEVLRAKTTTQPHDTGVQVALSLIEIPVQILNSYRVRQRQNSHTSQDVGLYRYSPQGSPYVASHMALSSSGTDASTPPSYTANSPLHGPSHQGGLSIPSSAYFQAALGPSEIRREPSYSSMGRTNSWHEQQRRMGMGSPQQSMGMVYGSSALTQQSRGGNELPLPLPLPQPGSKMDYFGQVQAPYSPYGSMDMNARFVTPSQLSA